MSGDVITAVLLPAILAFIMFSLGLGLARADFVHIVRQPRALLVGLLCQFVALPLFCFMLIGLVGLKGVFAVGFMILAACPTGSTSNLLSYFARGDVALAVSFTAVASLVTIFTLPVVVVWSLQYFAGDMAQAVAVPVGSMMTQVFLVMGLPVGLGMGLRHGWPALAQRWERRATGVAGLLFALIVVAAVARHWGLLLDNFSSLAGFALTLNVAMLVLGLAVGRLAGLSHAQSVTVALETAVQNATLAIVIGSSVLGNDALAVPGALYGVLMYVGCLPFVALMRRDCRRSAEP
jgi:BASS family bile acid:Na+ symporter